MTMELRPLVVGAALAALMLAVAVSDWRRFRVPDQLTALALALRAIDLIAAPAGARAEGLFEAALRAACVAALFYGFRAGYRRWRGREGLGLGDVKLAAVAGAWVDWPLLPYVVEAAALFGLGLALVQARRAGAAPRADAKLPFAVGFAPAIFLGWSLSGLGA
jgi:leader peptidase (prepilin peptidase)/N-methyltransferase